MTLNLVKTFVTAASCQKHEFKGEIEINMESKIPKASGRRIDIHFICYYFGVLTKYSLLKLLSQ